MPRGTFSEIRSKINQDQMSADDEADLNSGSESENARIFGKPWGVYDSNLKNFADTFIDLILEDEPHKAFEYNESGTVFKNYLCKHFGSRVGDLIGVELGGTGSKLFFELNNLNADAPIFKRSVGITLKDVRNPTIQTWDERNNHIVIPDGQVFLGGDKNKTAVKQILAKTNGERPDFILERMVAGISGTECSPEFWYLTINAWYKFLQVNGVIFIQVPSKFSDFEYRDTQKFIKDWADKILQNSEYVNDIRLKYEEKTLLIEKYSEKPLPRIKSSKS